MPSWAWNSTRSSMRSTCPVTFALPQLKIRTSCPHCIPRWSAMSRRRGARITRHYPTVSSIKDTSGPNISR